MKKGVFSLEGIIKVSMFLIVFLIAGMSAKAQSAGDFRSRVSGNWSDFTTWQVYDGATWVNAVAGQVPGGTSEADANNVYLEAGFTVTLTSDASCKDLHLNGTQDVVRINTVNFALDIWGKMRSYTGTAPGTTDNGSTGSGIAGWINTGSNGRLRFKGTVDRTIFAVNELTANSRTAGWRLDFAFSPGVTGYCRSTIRCGYLEVSSGTLDVRGIADGEVADYEIRVAGDDYTAQPGNGVSGGTVVVRTGATLKSYRLRKNNPVSAGNSLASFTLEEGALFVSKLNNQVPALTYSILGEVRFQGSGAQSFISTGGNVDAVPIVNYADVVLAGSGTKSLINNVSISGKLTMSGTATLSVASYALAYGPLGSLEYSGSALQTTSNAEFPASNGPFNLTINNANGVNLHANRSIEGELTLSAGILDIQGFNFTLGENSPLVAGIPSETNMVVTSGSGELRKVFSTPGYFFFPIGDKTGTTEYTYARVDVNSGDNLSSSSYVGVRVVDNDHPADAGVSFSNISRYWRVNSSIVNISYDVTVQYLASDVNGTESDINVYNYSDETPLATGVPIVRVNSVLHRLVATGLNSIGYLTGTNLCDISNNTINYVGTSAFCGTSTPDLDITGTIATVASGSPVYQWQQKLNTGSWMDIGTGGDGQNYTESSSLGEGNTYVYRRVVSDPSNCLVSDVNLSNEIEMDVYVPISGNQIRESQIINQGDTPLEFDGDAVLDGGDLSYTYFWQFSTVPGGPYSDIASANAATYQAAIGDEGFYIRKVVSGPCSSVSNEVSLSIVTANVDASFNESLVTVFPNPANDRVYLDVSKLNSGDKQLQLVNAQGRVLDTKAFQSESLLELNLTNYTNGLYYLRLSIDGAYVATYKIFKR